MNNSIMNHGDDKPIRSPLCEVSREIRAQLDEIAQGEAELDSCLRVAMAAELVDHKSLARLLYARSSATRQGIALVFHWLEQLDRRMTRIERRLANLAARGTDHAAKLRMICSLLEEMDDPYGYGLSLDEKILGEAAHHESPHDSEE